MSMLWATSLLGLQVRHGCTLPGEATWRLTSGGVVIDGLPRAVGTPGPPETVRRVWSWFGPEILAAASDHGVPVELLVAAICTESAGGTMDREACATARRQEPGWISDEETPSHVSVGCMQTLIETARRASPNNHNLTGADLLSPKVSIERGAAVMADDAWLSRYDPPLVAAAYNAGNLYRETGTQNRWGLRCYPFGTGRYIDTFIAWFNDAMSLPEAATLAAGSPSFVTGLAGGPQTAAALVGSALGA
jgi:hypothetical protein